MGLATIDPRSQKEHTEIHKIPKFGVNQAGFDWDNKEMYGMDNNLDQSISQSANRKHPTWSLVSNTVVNPWRHPDAVLDGVQMAIHFFVNFDIFKWLYLSEN